MQFSKPQIFLRNSNISDISLAPVLANNTAVSVYSQTKTVFVVLLIKLISSLGFVYEYDESKSDSSFPLKSGAEWWVG